MDQHPQFSEQAIERVSDVLRQGKSVGLSKFDPYISEAETSIANWQGVKYCLGTSTGHAALHAALIGLEVTDGDEVITSPYSWGASVSCILQNNAIPVFADVSPETGLLDPASIEAVITSRTKAILVVHIFGQPADMTSICAIAQSHGLAVIEDGSQAHGARHRGRLVGGFGDAAGFSCMGSKLLATTEAGYLVTNRDDVYWKACLGTQHLTGSPVRPGRAAEPGFPSELLPFADSLTYTYRLSTVNAVLLSEQVKHIDAANIGRNENVTFFKEAMAGVVTVSFPKVPDGDSPSYHFLTMNLDIEKAGVSRETYIAALRAEGLAGATAYVPSPIYKWRRLDPESGGPRTMWQENLRRSGRTYSDLSLPGCEAKVASSLELPWNYIVASEEHMKQLAQVFQKLEDNLETLREWEWERRSGTEN
jgi:dTDP-4-amino-4,6-dideoxygalactose transaminase